MVPPMTSYNDLFSLHIDNLSVQQKEEQVIRVPLTQLHSYRNHPFRVLDDMDMAALVESVAQKGVLVPGIVRVCPGGGYELISGHRRKRASELAGIADMPVIILDMEDDDATIVMVDANLQRTDLLPSEKAFAYRMRLDAMKRKAGRTGKSMKRSDAALAELAGESRNTIQRYIRLTYLGSELIELVDAGKIQVIAGSDLSYLTKREQENLIRLIGEYSIYPNGSQAAILKEYSKKQQLTEEAMKIILCRQKKAASAKVTLKAKTLYSYFPEEYTSEEMEDVIFQLLEKWKMENGG